MSRVYANDRRSDLMNRLRAPERLPWHWLLPLLFPAGRPGLSLRRAQLRSLRQRPAYRRHQVDRRARRTARAIARPRPALRPGSQPAAAILLADGGGLERLRHIRLRRALPAQPLHRHRRAGALGQSQSADLQASLPARLKRLIAGALYAIRFLSLCMGAGTVAAVYQAARTALPAGPGSRCWRRR